MLAIDLGLLNRRAHVLSVREAIAWSCVWVSLAGLFAILIWQFSWWWHPEEGTDNGSERALEFVTGYLIEQSLSVDNLFVFMVIFRYFAVPPQHQHRVLFWGILGALIMRASFILVGAALLNLFAWMTYVFGGILLYTSYKLIRSGDDELDPGKNPLLRFAKRFLPITDSYESGQFSTRIDGKRYLTPLLLVLFVVESTDVVFALDSIPAIFGVTKNPFIVYTSNIFAILGLRSLYFVIAGFLGKFRFLNTGLALVLAFVGLKMLAEEALHTQVHSLGLEKRDTIIISLAVIATIIGTAVLASILVKPKDENA